MNAQLHQTLRAVRAVNQPEFHYQGNFTVCLLVGTDGKVVSVGAAKRNPNCDSNVQDRGEVIALARAVKNLETRQNGH